MWCSGCWAGRGGELAATAEAVLYVTFVHIILLLIITNIGLSFVLVCTGINVVLFLALTYQ
jgi:hypothetical protein